MIDILVTCLLEGLFEPPDGWTLMKAFSPLKFGFTVDTRYCPEGCPPPRPYVVITRKADPGHVVEIPKDCNTIEIQGGAR